MIRGGIGHPDRHMLDNRPLNQWYVVTWETSDGSTRFVRTPPLWVGAPLDFPELGDVMHDGGEARFDVVRGDELDRVDAGIHQEAAILVVLREMAVRSRAAERPAARSAPVVAVAPPTRPLRCWSGPSSPPSSRAGPRSGTRCTSPAPRAPPAAPPARHERKGCGACSSSTASASREPAANGGTPGGNLRLHLTPPRHPRHDLTQSTRVAFRRRGKGGIGE